jgi:hypothetical protein
MTIWSNKPSKTVYVLGLQQTGGCWMWTGAYYETYNDALLARKDSDEKVFLLHLAERLPLDVDLSKEAA